MASPSSYFVDPSIAADSGAGTLGDPYGDLQYCLNTITRDSSNGDQINIKAGTDEILTAEIDLTSYGTPSVNVPLSFRGYTAAENDGGVGGISGNNGNFPIMDASGRDGVAFIDLHLHNCGTATYIIQLDASARLIGCEVDNCNGIGFRSQNNAQVIRNYFHDLGGAYACQTGNNCCVSENYYKQDGSRFTTTAAFRFYQGTFFYRNIASVSTGESAFRSDYRANRIIHNTALSDGGTGTGLEFAGAAQYQQLLIGNYIEGFSGVGGIGIHPPNSLTPIYSWNAIYNCTTAYDSGLPDQIHYVDNETLGSSGLAKSGADTFANRFTYFAPADVGNMLAGLPCGSDKGAVQTPNV